MKAGVFLTEDGKEIIELEAEFMKDEMAIESIKKRKHLRSDSFRVIEVKAKSILFQRKKTKRKSPPRLEIVI